MLWGGRNTANKYPWRVWGVLAVSGPHWVCPLSQRVCVPGLHFSGFRFLCRGAVQSRPWVLCTSQVHVLGSCTKAQTWLSLRFVPFPGPSSSGDLVLGEHTVPGVWCVLSPPWYQSLSFLDVQREHRLRCAICLLWGADLRLWSSWWMSTIQDPGKTWSATGSLLTVWWRMPSLGPGLPLAFRVWLLLPASLPLAGWWASPKPASFPLVLAQSFVLWAGRQCLRLEFFAGKFSPSLSLSVSLSFVFSPLFGYSMIWVAISC